MKHKIAPFLNDIVRNYIVKTYSRDKILIDEGPWHKYLFIPPELVISNYKRGFTKLNPVTGGRIRMGNQYTVEHLYDSTGLTLQEFFDLTVLNIKYVEDRPKCSYPGCNKYLTWSGSYHFGYGNSYTLWNSNDNHYCNHSCAQSNSVRLGNSGFGTFENQISAQWSQFMKSGDKTDLCVFYIAKAKNNTFKYGVADLSHNRFTYDGITKYKILYKGTREQVANLEYYVKRRLNTHLEYLEFNSFMGQFRGAYKLALKDLIESN